MMKKIYSFFCLFCLLNKFSNNPLPQKELKFIEPIEDLNEEDLAIDLSETELNETLSPNDYFSEEGILSLNIQNQINVRSNSMNENNSSTSNETTIDSLNKSSSVFISSTLQTTKEYENTLNTTETPIKNINSSTTPTGKIVPGIPDKSDISQWFPFIFILSLLLFCLVGIDPQQDLHLEALNMN